MINISKFVKNLENGLNALIPQNSGWRFKIFEDFGELRNFIKENQTSETERIINGVAIQRPGEIAPIQGLSNFDYIIDFAVYPPANPYDTDYSESVKNVLQEYITQNIGAATDIDNYAVLTNFDMLASGQYEQLPGLGSSISYSTTIYCSTIKDGLISNLATIKLNGETLIWFNFSIDCSRVQQPDSFENSENIKNVIVSQGNTFGFMLPYRNTEQLRALAKAIWEQDLTTTWELEYSDPIIGTQTKTVVMSQGTKNLQGGTIGTLNVQFISAETLP